MADNPRQEVLEILQDIKLPGSFSTGGTCEASLNTPGIEVDGVGVLGLPLCDAQAQRVRARCEQAHFGKGSKAVVDKTVRNMFQLAPKHFKITNPTWGSDLAALVSQVCCELGVQSHLKVQAQLYKMLWYEEGSFFTMHCDSKKVDGMLATLVVTLPSVYSGGELVVQHQGKEKIFPPSQMSAFLSHYASFYADCKYELKPVTLGHQLCLVYNLVKTGDGQFPDAQQGCDVIKRLKSAAANWGEDFDGSKLVIMTEHQYTPYGLKCSSGSVKFKGYDAEIVDALEIAIKEGVDLDWDHGTVSYSESGCAKSGGCCGGYEWYKTTDSFVSLALSLWGQVGIRKKEIEPEDYWEDKDAVNKNFELIGNEGVKAERQYYDAEAIVVWPRSQQWVVVTNNNVDKMTSFLLKACTPDTEGLESKEECIQKAQSVADKIAWARAYSVDLSCSKANSQRNVSMLLKALIQLGDQAIALKVLSQYITANTTVTPDLILEELLPFIDCFGVDSVRPCIMATVDGKYSCTDPTTALQFVIQLCNQLLKDKDVRNYTSLATDLIIGFIDRLAPNNKNDNWSPQKSLDNFPLADVLRMFHGNDAVVPNGGSLVKRVIDYLIWASCQPLPVQSTGPCTGSSKPRGPMVLLQCTTELVDTLDTLPQGWNDFASILTDAVNALCKLKSVDAAIRLVEALAPQGPNILDSDQGQACKDMALIVCEYVLKFSATNKTINAQSVLIAYKKLFRIIARYCPSQVERFVTTVKVFDVNSVLVPFVTDNTTRNVATSQEMQNALDQLTNHCANILSSRLSKPLGSKAAWTLPTEIPLPQNPTYINFLKNPCQRVYDWKVRKSDHKGFMGELSALIRAGEIKAESYQPGEKWSYHFKITKLKSRRIPIAEFAQLTYNCSSPNGGCYSHKYNSAVRMNSCLLSKCKKMVEQRMKDEKSWSLMNQLLPLELCTQSKSRKRQTSEESNAAVATATSSSHTNTSYAKKAKQGSIEVIDLT